MKKTCNVVMLSTEKASSILLTQSKLYYTGDNTEPPRNSSKNQHLYIVSDDDAVEGDWVTNGFQLAKVNCLTVNDPNKYLHKRVIASTDESLGYPGIPPAFIEAYIKAYNNGSLITQVDLEMDADYDEYYGAYYADTIKIKTRSDNTVIIHQSKMYSKDELRQQLNNILNDLLCQNYGKDDFKALLKNPDSNKIGIFVNNWLD